MRSISPTGLSLLKGFEHFMSIWYPDQAGWETIGYGHRKVIGESFELPITEDRASALLESDLNIRFCPVVSSLLQVPVNQNQFDALVIFAFNVGTNAFRSSTLLKMLNAGGAAGAAEQFLRWNKVHVHGVEIESEGLTHRRTAERKLFLKVEA